MTEKGCKPNGGFKQPRSLFDYRRFTNIGGNDPPRVDSHFCMFGQGVSGEHQHRIQAKFVSTDDVCGEGVSHHQDFVLVGYSPSAMECS